MYAEPSGSNQCAEPSGSNLYVINWQSEGVAPQYYQTLLIPLACNRGSLSCVCSIALGVNVVQTNVNLFATEVALPVHFLYKAARLINYSHTIIFT